MPTCFVPWKPNARRQARRAAGAKRTLYAVACTPSLRLSKKGLSRGLAAHGELLLRAPRSVCRSRARGPPQVSKSPRLPGPFSFVALFSASVALGALGMPPPHQGRSWRYDGCCGSASTGEGLCACPVLANALSAGATVSDQSLVPPWRAAGQRSRRRRACLSSRSSVGTRSHGLAPHSPPALDGAAVCQPCARRGPPWQLVAAAS